MINKINWRQTLFTCVFYTLALALPVSEALKQISVIIIIILGLSFFLKKELTINKNLLTYSAVGLVLSSVISAFFAFNISEALKAYLDISRIILIFLIIKNIQLKSIQLIRFNQILFISMFIALAYGLYRIYFFPEPFPEITYLELKSVGHVNHSSIYLMLVFIIALSWFFIKDRQLPDMHASFLFLIIISSLIGIFISGSRATMFTSTFLMFVLFFISKQYKNPKLLTVFVLLVIAVLGILLSSEYSMEKFSLGVSGPATSFRKELYEASILAWMDHNLIFGIGTDNSHYINPQDYINTEFNEISHSHNTYINYLLERGISGLALYLVFIFTVLLELLKQYQLTKHRLVIAALLIWLANFIISWVNTTFHDENGLLMVIIWGLALNQSYIEDRQSCI